jgi:hypothetical protein
MFDTPPNQPIDPAPSAAQPAQPPAVPSAVPPSAPVEDMFAGTESAVPEKPAAFLPKQNDDLGLSVGENDSGKRSLLPLYAAIGVLILAAAVYFSYGKIMSLITGPDSPSAPEAAVTDPTPVPDLPAPSVPAAVTDPTPDTSVDTPPATVPAMPAVTAPDTDLDQDGLTDAEEERLGTNAQSVDSDNDGLFDREEARVYKTDPLNPDTDGDGFRDGDEVRGGYNPAGSGKLYDLPAQQP